MRSARRGKSTSSVEVTNISRHGFWLLVAGKELFLAFEDFPWFQDVSVSQLLNVQLPQAHHLYWPDLDVDIAVESITQPEQYPLVSKVRNKDSEHRSAINGGPRKAAAGGTHRR